VNLRDFVQPSILAGEGTGLLTQIAATVSVSLSERAIHEIFRR
jgi:hypothetical protein